MTELNEEARARLAAWERSSEAREAFHRGKRVRADAWSAGVWHSIEDGWLNWYATDVTWEIEPDPPQPQYRPLAGAELFDINYKVVRKSDGMLCVVDLAEPVNNKVRVVFSGGDESWSWITAEQLMDDYKYPGGGVIGVEVE